MKMEDKMEGYIISDEGSKTGKGHDHLVFWKDYLCRERTEEGVSGGKWG